MEQSLTIAENSDQYLNLELPCNNSYASGAAISYQLASYNGVTLPSYLTINQNTGAISISSKNVTADTYIEFYVNSIITGIPNPVQKLINLKILN
ncbi:putative Ig domain-containing protein [Reyranella sp.]|uniref:putative Ig domain-containing protein n=1 Tax=Reyranella sp. TaxID=1929291 RepID=UPI003BA84A38